MAFSTIPEFDMIDVSAGLPYTFPQQHSLRSFDAVMPTGGQAHLEQRVPGAGAAGWKAINGAVLLATDELSYNHYGNLEYRAVIDSGAGLVLTVL